MVKNILSVATLTIALSFSSVAQQLQFSYLSTAYNGGDTLSISGTSSQDELEGDIDITNVSGSTISAEITRVKINEMTGAQDYLCWGVAGDPFAICYPSSSVSPNDPWTTPTAVNMANNAIGDLAVHYAPTGTIGTSHYRYYLINGSSTKIDSIDVKFTTTSSLGIASNNINKLDLLVYPNPAKNTLSVKVDGATSLSIKILDMLGSVVYTNQLQNGTDKIDVSTYNDGIYFVVVGSDSKSVLTKKIIIRN